MNLRVLFFGDVVGPLGRKAVQTYLSQHKETDHIDFVIANGENTTHGHGLSVKHYNELISYGVNCITSGNHFFNSPEAMRRINDYPLAIRPYNLDKHVPGVGSRIYTVNGIPIRVSNLLGRAFLAMTQTNPFYALDEIIQEDKERIIHIVDFHAEATAEKRCLAEYADGRITALLGTHTHVQTNDSKKLNKGTFLLTDVGMNGAYDSCLGDEKENAIYRTMTGIPSSLDVPRKGKMMVNAVLLDIDTSTKEVQNYRVINETIEDN